MGYTSLAFVRHAQGDWEAAHRALAHGREIAVQEEDQIGPTETPDA